MGLEKTFENVLPCHQQRDDLAEDAYRRFGE
jgi:hypothetical protein